MENKFPRKIQTIIYDESNRRSSSKESRILINTRKKVIKNEKIDDKTQVDQVSVMNKLLNDKGQDQILRWY